MEKLPLKWRFKMSTLDVRIDTITPTFKYSRRFRGTSVRADSKDLPKPNISSSTDGSEMDGGKGVDAFSDDFDL